MLGKLTRRELSVFLVLFFVGLVCSIDKSLIGVATPIIRGQFGYSASEFANVTNMYYASNIIMTFVSGYIMDRFGFKPFSLTLYSSNSIIILCQSQRFQIFVTT